MVYSANLCVNLRDRLCDVAGQAGYVDSHLLGVPGSIQALMLHSRQIYHFWPCNIG